MKYLFTLFLWLVLSTSPLQAKVIKAVSCSQSDVEAAISVAASGDTILVPPGDCTWSTQVTFGGKGVQFIGAGRDLTTIKDGSTDGTNLVVSGATVDGEFFRVSGFRFTDSGATGTAGRRFWTINGQSKQVRFDNIFYENVAGDNKAFLQLDDGTYSLTDHVEISGTNVAQYHPNNLNWAGSTQGFGDQSWNSAATIGGEGNHFLEDSLMYDEDFFASSATSGLVDIDHGGRAVYRYNQLYGLTLSSHGTESGGRNRGGRHVEIYRNTGWSTGADIWHNTRSGSTTMFENTLRGYNGLGNIQKVRLSHTFNVWKRCDGTFGMDNNGTLQASGTIAVGGGVDCIAGAGTCTVTASGTPGWTTDQFVDHSLHNKTRKGSGGGGTPSYRSSIAETQSASATVTVTKPTGTVDGDGMIVCIADAVVNRTVDTIPTGWTQFSWSPITTGGNDSKAWCFHKIAASEGASWDWVFSNTINGASIAYTAQDTHATTLIDDSDGQATVDGTSHSTPSITPTNDNNLLVTFFAADFDLASPTWTPPSGMTEREDHEGSQVVAASINDELQVTAAAVSKTATSSETDEAIAVIISLAPGSGGGAATCDQASPDNEACSGWITANTADTVTYLQDEFVGDDSMDFSDGEEFEIYSVTNCFDLIGYGSGDLIDPDNPPDPMAWPNQTIEKNYEWDNFKDGTEIDWSDEALYRSGTHYENDTVRTGYKPYIYPHPLQFFFDRLPEEANIEMPKIKRANKHQIKIH